MQHRSKGNANNNIINEKFGTHTLLQIENQFVFQCYWLKEFLDFCEVKIAQIS